MGSGHSALGTRQSEQWPSAESRESRTAIRRIAWILILAAAAFDAYVRRHSITPDGISYLDLSDAVVQGRPSGLVNLYWSPLYPALVGLVRLVVRPNAYWEFATFHLLNVLLVAVALAAFDWFLEILLRRASSWPRSPIATRWGIAASYIVFGSFLITMTPPELPTPDLLTVAAVLVAFGALLGGTGVGRWESGVGKSSALTPDTRHPTPDAPILGIALALGSLAKSFLVPWSLVCFVCFWVATRRQGIRPTLLAILPWVLIVGPWAVILSSAAGRPTFGDAGRLTYAWYVNMKDTPSSGLIAGGARHVDTDSLLPGTGITGDAPGTDPLWFDPARWNTSLAPEWNARQQLDTLGVFLTFYIKNLTPLLFALMLIGVAERGARREAWRRGWVVFVPALAGLGAYAIVIVTSRYVMPFLLGGTLVLVAALPWPRRIPPVSAFVGVLLPLALEGWNRDATSMLALLTAVVVALIASYAAAERPPLARFAIALVAAGIARVFLPSSFPMFVRVAALGAALWFWRAASLAVRARHPRRFADVVGQTLAFMLLLLIVWRAALRLNEDRRALARPVAGAANSAWEIARDLRETHGIAAGTRIAVIGPHAESYWARPARLTIVADVPAAFAPAFWSLPVAKQDSLLARFAGAGATVAIATVFPDSIPNPRAWTRARYGGLIRRLPP